MMNEEALGWVIRTRDPEFDDWDAFTIWLEGDPARATAYDALMAADADLADMVPAEPVVMPVAANDAGERQRRPLRWIGGGAIAAALVAAVKEAEARFGPADALINNAGVMLLGAVSEQDPTQWEQMLDVNVKGLLNGIHAVLGGMIERNHGTVINVGSVAGRKTFPNHVAYVGTKFAVHGLSENLREELAPHNVRVITIAPGAVETELLISFTV